MTNPYQSPPPIAEQRGYGDHAQLLRRGFLYRRIQLHAPLEAVFHYNGWNFLQRIFFDDHLVWWRISWLTIHRRAVFRLPRELDPEERAGEMEIHFSAGLRMQRFTLRIAGEVVYDEPA